MKIASFNVENLFDRTKVFNEDTTVSTPILSATAELNSIFQADDYSAHRVRMRELITELGLDDHYETEYVLLRQLRGQIISRPQNAPFEIKASGRFDWVGWVELKTAPVDETAILNTARVISDVKADIIAVVEAENRIVLKQFNDQMLKKVGGTPYEQVMVIDGNDLRGIDVGLMTTNGYTIDVMRSHIHDLKDDGYPIFSRDCPEFAVLTPQDETVWIIPNHFKSKYGGNSLSSRAKRKAQATRTAEIYQALRDQGHQLIVVLGDLNDTPDSDELTPLLKNTDLKDVLEHASFDIGEFTPSSDYDQRGIGTYDLGNDDDKIDYLLLSPALFERISSCGLFRRGAWPGSRPPRWPVYAELQEKHHAASDHHVIWAEIADV